MEGTTPAFPSLMDCPENPTEAALRVAPFAGLGCHPAALSGQSALHGCVSHREEAARRLSTTPQLATNLLKNKDRTDPILIDYWHDHSAPV